MADKFLKTLKLPGIDEPYKIPQTAEDVGARPDTWLPTAADVGAAPAGHGLGEYVASRVALTDANSTVLSGWYYIDANTANGVGVSATLVVDGYGSKYTTQTAILASTGHRKIRHLINGTWSEWEWIDPPMTNDVEYCTIERWNGHPVYVKNVSCGALTEGRKLVEISGLAGCVVFDAYGYVNQGGNNFTMIPSIYSRDLNATISVSLLVNTQGNIGYIQLWGGSGLVGKNAFVQLKYFKL